MDNPVAGDDFSYLSGFGNHLSSEALSGALPAGQNSPLVCPFGLYAEQISGTSFTSPRHRNLFSWFYRIKPSVTHEPFKPRVPSNRRILSEFNNSNSSANPTQLRWKPMDAPDSPTDFIDGLSTVCGSGSSFMRHGYAIHMYNANKSMDNCAFCNADGDFLIVAQQGRLLVTTECGRLKVSPGEIAILPQGFRFSVNLPDGPSRGYVAEIFGTHFQLPDLGPIGANGLAAPRDFLVPTAWFEDKSYPGYTIVQKFGGELFAAVQDFSPFNVVAWHGNYFPYKYDLSKFCPYNTVLFDHSDPSINTVLTAPTDKPGVALLDFVIFPPRWLVAEHTFRPPYYHRNCMSEFMGLIHGGYEAKADGFLPGGASLHNCMTPHGPDTKSYESPFLWELCCAALMARNSNNNSTSGSGTVTILDPSQDPMSHYYVHPSEGPSSVSITPQLIAKNYHSWARMMSRALIAKNKYKFVDGTLLVSLITDSQYFAWERCNNLVHSWINYISPSIGESVVFMENAIDVWFDLKERCSQGDLIHVLELK